MIQTGVLGDNFAGGTIRGNSIYGNGGLGIDMLGDGPTPNDPLDADTIQNYPGPEIGDDRGEHPRPRGPALRRDRPTTSTSTRTPPAPAFRGTSTRGRPTSAPFR